MATKDSSASLHNIEDTSRNEKIKFTAKHISPTSNLHSKDTSVDPNQVNLEGADDQNPKDWPLWQKWCIVTLVATMFMLKYVCSTYYSQEKLMEFNCIQICDGTDIG
jgi:hypothetical protein